MMRRALSLLALGAALSSCSGSNTDRTPDPASADERRALSQAAEMLDERPREPVSQEGQTAERSHEGDTTSN